jgi:hypothetical protein
VQGAPLQGQLHVEDLTGAAGALPFLDQGQDLGLVETGEVGVLHAHILFERKFEGEKRLASVDG